VFKVENSVKRVNKTMTTTQYRAPKQYLLTSPLSALIWSGRYLVLNSKICKTTAGIKKGI